NIIERGMWAILLEKRLSPTLNVISPTVDSVLPPPSKRAKMQSPVGQSSNHRNEAIISRVKYKQQAIYSDGSETNGPGFGRSDLRMGSNGNTSLWHCKQMDYQIPIRKINESEWFIVDELEVYQ
ncbi:15406_t:CDS:2, partial [Cetraspora pellucida]